MRCPSLRFEGGSVTDLYRKGEKEIGEAKRDPRLKGSGRLIAFRFEGIDSSGAQNRLL